MAKKKIKEELGSRAFAPGGIEPDPGLGRISYSNMLVAPKKHMTIGSEVPLAPSAKFTAQLTNELPPVDDDEYTPITKSDLGAACQALVSGFSTEEIQKVYHMLKKSVNKTRTKSVSEAVKPPIPAISFKPGSGSALAGNRKEFASLQSRVAAGEILTDKELDRLEELEDIFGDQDVEDPETAAALSRIRGAKAAPSWSDIGSTKDPIKDIKGSYDDRLEMVVEPVDMTPDGATYDEIAKDLGITISGVKGSIDKIIRRMETIERMVKPQELTNLKEFAKNQFVEGLSSLVEPDDVTALKLNIKQLDRQDSFRFFFVNTFMLPVYNSMYKDASEKIESLLVGAGFPKNTAVTIKNIIFGHTATTPEQLKQKLQADLAADGDMTRNSPDELINRLQSMYPELKRIAQMRDADFASVARARWDGFSEGRKQSEIRKALEETEAFEEELASKMPAAEE